MVRAVAVITHWRDCYGRRKRSTEAEDVKCCQHDGEEGRSWKQWLRILLITLQFSSALRGLSEAPRSEIEAPCYTVEA